MTAQRIAVVGNTCGGKTLMSRRLAKQLTLPLIHVDSIQFVSGMKIRPHADTIRILREESMKPSWIIDGYGPLDIIEERFLIADRIVFIDLPLWLHYFWASKRQIQNLWSRRTELPPGCNEASLAQTLKIFKTLKVVHQKMRPELLKIFNRDHLTNKTLFIRNLKEWNRLYRDGI